MSEFSTLVTAAAQSGGKMSIGDAAITAIFGYLVVFFGLFILMGVLYLVAAIFKARDTKKTNAAKEENSAAEVSAEPAAVSDYTLAPGSAGHVKLYDVPDREAAMIMAIVADKMKKPLNELRFISIREVKEDEVQSNSEQ